MAILEQTKFVKQKRDKLELLELPAVALENRLIKNDITRNGIASCKIKIWTGNEQSCIIENGY